MTQNYRVLCHLKSGMPLTSLEALNLYGIARLSARIFELKENGYHIVSNTVKRRTRFGNRVSIVEYRMGDDGE